ncbi:hypothetical protein EZV62_017074 [Acer yangbiense]|uniref:Beta-glucosidase n=1 Tax=Acer yangbiense TaxID=1000413 RepID=A0A5C7HFN2_9ROSI|nr:hypothetical protein EZV62_017074 [Acer yangbiense]
MEGMADNGSVPLKVGVNDKLRIIYLDGHLKYLLKAMKKAYYVWSFLDDFEWDSGYTARFGLTYVDFKNNLTRHLKDSAFWYKRDDYRDYADFCFQEFGDRVKYWITLNEPNLFSSRGYASGIYAPGRCSNYIGNCSRGNSATEPYLVTHHLILSHAYAVKLYRDKYQFLISNFFFFLDFNFKTSQKGIVGITVDCRWQVPKFQTVSSRKAAFRALDFEFGWVVHPMTNGDYPKTMRCLVGNRLPNFTNEESILIKGTLDFVGLNYYTSLYADDATSYSSVFLSYTTDSHVNDTAEKNGIPIGELAGGNWLYMYPKGIREFVLYVKRKYSGLPIYITENGMADNNNNSLPIDEALDDDLRIKYHHLHLSYLLQAIKVGADVRGYSIWSVMDDFEWNSGYTLRFGLTYVDYKNGLKRYLKKSAFWFKNFLQMENATTDSSLLVSS